MEETVFLTGERLRSGPPSFGRWFLRAAACALSREATASADTVSSLGAEPIRGDLDVRESLVEGARGAAVVVHAAASLTSGVRYRDHDWFGDLLPWMMGPGFAVFRPGTQPPLTLETVRLIGHRIELSNALAQRELGYAPTLPRSAGLARMRAAERRRAEGPDVGWRQQESDAGMSVVG